MKFWTDRYDRNLIRDTKILYKLYNLAAVGMATVPSSLKEICKRMLGIDIDKDEGVRCTFDQYLNKPFSSISEEHLRYAALDAIYTFDAYCKLLSYIDHHDSKKTLLSHDIQVKGSLALDNIYKNGIGFDVEGRNNWVKEVSDKMKVQSERLSVWGWIRGKKGIKNTYEDIMSHIGIKDKLPRSEKSNMISAKEEDLLPYSDKPFVKDYLDFLKLEKACSFVEPHTSDVIHPRYNELVNTGRTSCSSPNIQQLPRMGGIRELFRPKKKESTLIICDYSAIELVTLAQVCVDKYGSSVMADKLNQGMDPHRYYASVLLAKDEEDITKEERQKAKAANFGFPGGLGIKNFILFAKGYGLDLSEDEAQRMKDAWFDSFPEMRDYMKNERGFVYTRTGRKRADTSYCAEKNTPFQGLAADGAKIAMYECMKKGLELVAFVHDEIVIEVSKGDAEEAQKALEAIMIEGMKKVVPDVDVRVESKVSEVYTK